MTQIQPWKLIVVGFVLVLLGFLLPMLMVVDVIESSFLLSFFSHGASVSGLFLGLIGSALYVRSGREKR